MKRLTATRAYVQQNRLGELRGEPQPGYRTFTAELREDPPRCASYTARRVRCETPAEVPESPRSFAGTFRSVNEGPAEGPRRASRGPFALCLVHRAEGPMRNSGGGSRLPAELRGDPPRCASFTERRVRCETPA